MPVVVRAARGVRRAAGMLVAVAVAVRVAVGVRVVVAVHVRGVAGVPVRMPVAVLVRVWIHRHAGTLGARSIAMQWCRKTLFLHRVSLQFSKNMTESPTSP